jgi:hypothetical protein
MITDTSPGCQILRRGKVAYALTDKLLMRHAYFLIVIKRIKYIQAG